MTAARARRHDAELAPLLDEADFRKAMGCFPTGVALLASGSGHGAHVITVNSLVSVSLDPPLVLVGVKTTGRIRDLVTRRGSFAVNVLTSSQRDVCAEFARSSRLEGRPAMRRLAAIPGGTGDAILPSALAAFECELFAEHPGGDHVLFIGRVVAIHSPDPDRAPLLFHRGRYSDLT